MVPFNSNSNGKSVMKVKKIQKKFFLYIYFQYFSLALDKQQMAQGALLDEVLTAENRLFMDIVPTKGSDEQISIRWRHDGKTACKQQTTPTTTVSPGVQPTTHDYSKPLTPEQRKDVIFLMNLFFGLIHLRTFFPKCNIQILLNHRSIKHHQKVLGFSDRDMEIMLECYDERNEIIKQCNFPKAPPGIVSVYCVVESILFGEKNVKNFCFSSK